MSTVLATPALHPAAAAPSGLPAGTLAGLPTGTLAGLPAGMLAGLPTDTLAATHAVALTPLTQRDQKRAYSDNKLEKRLCREVGRAIGDFNMVNPGDRVMVCLSGGKDSYGLLEILLLLRERAPIDFDIIAVNLDQKQPGFPKQVLPDYLAQRGVQFHIEEQDTYSIVKRVIPEGKTTCGLCSRLRRGILYRVAGELGATKIALGHHQGDILETLFLNMFFNGRMKAMPPKLTSDDGKHIVIRPLAYVKETDLERFAAIKRFPIIPCNLCGAQETLQRREIKQMLAEWDKRFPGRIESIASSLAKVTPSHLMDASLFGFHALAAGGAPDAAGDMAFDAVPCGTPAGTPLVLGR